MAAARRVMAAACSRAAAKSPASPINMLYRLLTRPPTHRATTSAFDESPSERIDIRDLREDEPDICCFFVVSRVDFYSPIGLDQAGYI